MRGQLVLVEGTGVEVHRGPLSSLAPFLPPHQRKEYAGGDPSQGSKIGSADARSAPLTRSLPPPA